MASIATAPSREAHRAARDRSKAKTLAARRKRLLSIGLLSVLLMALVWLHVWLRLQVVHMGYVLSTASKLQGRLEQEGRDLKVELATMTSPERLETMARRRLQLAQAEKGQVVVLP